MQIPVQSKKIKKVWASKSNAGRKVGAVWADVVNQSLDNQNRVAVLNEDSKGRQAATKDDSVAAVWVVANKYLRTEDVVRYETLLEKEGQTKERVVIKRQIDCVKGGLLRGKGKKYGGKDVVQASAGCPMSRVEVYVSCSQKRIPVNGSAWPFGLDNGPKDVPRSRAIHDASSRLLADT